MQCTNQIKSTSIKVSAKSPLMKLPEKSVSLTLQELQNESRKLHKPIATISQGISLSTLLMLSITLSYQFVDQ